MKRYVISSIVALSLAITAASAKTYATVDGIDVTDRDIGSILQVIPGANFHLMTKEQKKKIIDQAIDKKLLAEKAVKSGIENSAEFKKALEGVKRDLALELWMKQEFDKIKVSDKELKSFYHKKSSMFNRPAMAKARHILVASKDEAQKIIKELDKAKDKKSKFISLAKSKSTGPSASNGGELGWFDKKRMVKEFSDAAFKLKKGHYTKHPVKTQFGYHVIYLEDKRPSGSVSFEKAKPSILQTLKVQAFQKKMKEITKKLRSSADIKIK